jgi:hypothetical protein
MQEQKASNEVFQKTCQAALLKTHDEIEQDIKLPKQIKNTKLVIGLVNTPGRVRIVE